MAETGTEARPPLLQANAALYLDFDGTLAAHAPHPDGVTIEQALPALLAGLRERLSGAVALVTGRSLEALDALTGLPRYAGAGLHGFEWRLESGQTHSAGDPAGASRIADALRARFGSDPRLVVEDKGAAVALHFRRAPERAAECIAAMHEVASVPGFEILDGHAVVEARPAGADKGAAIRALSAHAPFARRLPVFVGDDRTDEDGFRAAQDLGGFGVKVGAGATGARYRIAAVDDVFDWLAGSLEALSKETGT
jgi:trehalose 6-phosphate phosphatase